MTEQCEDMISFTHALEATFGNVQGDVAPEIREELAELHSAPVLAELSSSAFSFSNINTRLRDLEIESIVFSGIRTSQCADLTACDFAGCYGSGVVEGVASRDRQDYHTSTLQRLCGCVLSAGQVLDDLATALRGRTESVPQ